MLFFLLVAGSVFWGAMAVALLTLNPYQLVTRGKSIPQLDKAVAAALFACIEISIFVSIGIIWYQYNDQSGWNMLGWLFLPFAALILFGAYTWRYSADTSGED